MMKEATKEKADSSRESRAMALLLRSELQRCQLLLWLFEVRVEPSDGAGDAIAIVGRFREVVAFVFVDDERRFDTFGF